MIGMAREVKVGCVPLGHHTSWCWDASGVGAGLQALRRQQREEMRQPSDSLWHALRERVDGLQRQQRQRALCVRVALQLHHQQRRHVLLQAPGVVHCPRHLGRRGERAPLDNSTRGAATGAVRCSPSAHTHHAACARCPHLVRPPSPRLPPPPFEQPPRPLRTGPPAPQTPRQSHSP